MNTKAKPVVRSTFMEVVIDGKMVIIDTAKLSDEEYTRALGQGIRLLAFNSELDYTKLLVSK